MADKNAPRRVRKQPESVRQRASKQQTEKRHRRVRNVTDTAKKPISAATKAGRKEYHPIKLPDSKLGRLLGKRVRFVPKYFRNAWQEIKQVTWPNARETTKLTVAVIIFALVLGGLVWALDYGLNKLFREVLLG